MRRFTHLYCNEEWQEVVGTLLGFDDSVGTVIEDITEFEITPEGRRITKLDQILLNGNNITMLAPGGEGPEVEIDTVVICEDITYIYVI